MQTHVPSPSESDAFVRFCRIASPDQSIRWRVLVPDGKIEAEFASHAEAVQFAAALDVAA